MKNILLLSGGKNTEHEISLKSADFIKSSIDSSRFNVHQLVMDKDGSWPSELELTNLQKNEIDVVIPCLHGNPGENGKIQSYFEMINIPFLGCEAETSEICFNKAMTKLWLKDINIPHCEFEIINTLSENDKEKSTKFYDKYQDIFVKATNQGSSVGCYHVTKKSELISSIEKALSYSPYVILERTVKGREFEISLFEYNGEIHITKPGEILCPEGFYSYEQKYDKDSKTGISLEASEISEANIQLITKYCRQIQNTFKIRHMSRVDFFIENDKILINEINTFPGHTAISLFPMMMENYGVKYSDFINFHLNLLTK